WKRIFYRCLTGQIKIARNLFLNFSLRIIRLMGQITVRHCTSGLRQENWEDGMKSYRVKCCWMNLKKKVKSQRLDVTTHVCTKPCFVMILILMMLKREGFMAILMMRYLAKDLPAPVSVNIYLIPLPISISQEHPSIFL